MENVFREQEQEQEHVQDAWHGLPGGYFGFSLGEDTAPVTAFDSVPQPSALFDTSVAPDLVDDLIGDLADPKFREFALSDPDSINTADLILPESLKGADGLASAHEADFLANDIEWLLDTLYEDTDATEDACMRIAEIQALLDECRPAPAPSPSVTHPATKRVLTRCAKCYHDYRPASECGLGVPGEPCACCARAGLECTSTIRNERHQRVKRRCKLCRTSKKLVSVCRPTITGEACGLCVERGLVCHP